MTRTTKWYQKVASGIGVHDYVLTKAQGSHSGTEDHETYGHIQKGFHREGRLEREEQALEEVLASIKDGPSADISRKSAQDDYAANVTRINNSAGVQLDVVTIRNRRGPFSRQVTLFSAYQLLVKNGFKYSPVHCYFCRGIKTDHNVTENKGSGN